MTASKIITAVKANLEAKGYEVKETTKFSHRISVKKNLGNNIVRMVIIQSAEDRVYVQFVDQNEGYNIVNSQLDFYNEAEESVTIETVMKKVNEALMEKDEEPKKVEKVEETEEQNEAGDDLTENEHAFALFLKTCQSFDEWEEGSDGCLTLFLDTVVEDLRKFGVNTNIQGVGGYLTSLQQKGYIGKPYNDGDADEYIRFVPFNGKLWFVK